MKMLEDLAQKAINQALEGCWKDAISTNLQILKSYPCDVDALNRLAKAYSESGKLNKAKVVARRALKIDPYNNIAQKCLNKWQGLKSGSTLKTVATASNTFIEEPGKTKLVNLMHISSPKLLARLDCGDELKLNLQGHRISIVGIDGKYIGRLPDNIGSRIKQLIVKGKEYKTFLKSVDKDGVKVFIKETFSPSKYSDIPSFPSEKIEYVSFTPPELVHKKDEIMAFESEEE